MFKEGHEVPMHSGAKWCFNLGNNERSASKKNRIRDQKAVTAAASAKKEDGAPKTVVTYDPSGYDRSAVREKVLTAVKPQKETDAIKGRAMQVAYAPGKQIPQAAFMLCKSHARWAQRHRFPLFLWVVAMLVVVMIVGRRG